MARNITDRKTIMSKVIKIFPHIVVFGSDYIHLGARVSINAFCVFTATKYGSIIIGDDVVIGPFVLMNSADHKFIEINKKIREQSHIFETIKIGSDVWIGGHVSILRGSIIPDKCVIGAGSVVTRHNKLDVGGVYVGNPLRFVKRRF